MTKILLAFLMGVVFSGILMVAGNARPAVIETTVLRTLRPNECIGRVFIHKRDRTIPQCTRV